MDSFGDDFKRGGWTSGHFLDGDIYTEEEEVTRGIALAPAWEREVEWDKKGSLLAGAPQLALPVEDLGLGSVAVAARGVDAAAFLDAVQGFLETAGHVVGPGLVVGDAHVVRQDAELAAELCVGYELLGLGVRFCAPRAGPWHVAAVWQREAGDGVTFLAVVRECTASLQKRGLAVEQVAGGAAAKVAPGALPFEASLAPHLAEETPPVTPSGALHLPKLQGSPCSAEDLEPLLAQGQDEDPRARAEAVAVMNKTIDDGLDADMLITVLQEHPDAVLGWVEDPACALCGPALGRKLAARQALPTMSLVPALLRGLAQGKEASALGERQLARALAEVLASAPPSPAPQRWKAELVSLQCRDAAAQRYVSEALIALS